MTELPPSLRPWAAQLSQLTPDVPVAVGPWLPRLAVAVGPMRSTLARGVGEPDGVEGITRRGPYERLLGSEWALAGLAPLEFLRRAAEGEHLFLERRRVEPAGSRRCVALLDAGPDQLGAPRLAQLALLVVLARRAGEAGADFLWGVLQDEGRALRPLDEQAAARLFEARSARRASGADREDWQALVGSDEAWVIGHAPDWGRRVQVRQPLGSSCLRLDVGGVALELELPDGDEGARVFRGARPGRKRAQLPLAIAPDFGMQFSTDGRRLLVGLRRGPGEPLRLAAIHVPDNSRASAGQPRVVTVPSRWSVLGADWRGRRACVLVADEGGIGMLAGRSDTLQTLWRAPVVGDPLPPVHGGLRLAAVGPGLRGASYWASGVGDRLYQLTPDCDRPDGLPQLVRSSVIEDHTLALVNTRWRTVYGARNDGTWMHLVSTATDGTVRMARRFEGEGPFVVKAGCGVGTPELGLVAVQAGPGGWQILWGEWVQESGVGRTQERVLVLPARDLGGGERPGYVIGPTPGSVGGARRPGLLCVRGGHTRLEWIGEASRRSLKALPSPIVDARLALERSHVALLLASGELRVRALDDDRDLVVVRPAGVGT